MRRKHNPPLAVVSIFVLLLAACTETARLPFSATVGRNPTIPPPARSPIPMMLIAPALGWPAGEKPVGAPGTTVTAFAANLDHPRWLHVLPNGDVLVAETNAPPRPEDNKGLKGWVKKKVMKRAGATVPSANRITLLRDADGDGVAETRAVFLEGLNSPFGMALVGTDLYVANTDAVMRFPYADGVMRITAQGIKVADLPAGPRNHHWTKNIIASRDGSKLYATVGSNSNVAEHGIEEERGRAAVWEIDVNTRTHRIFASGLRNPNGLALEPTTGSLWTVVNERDELGSDLVPDYLTSVKDGGFYGWPYSYFGAHIDDRVQPQRPDLIAKAMMPDYSLGPHVAALGLAHSRGNTLPAAFADGMFVGQHGSWNRRPRSGYNVIFVPFKDGMPSGPPIEVLSGFVSAEGKAYEVAVRISLSSASRLQDHDSNVTMEVNRAYWHFASPSSSISAFMAA